MIQRIYVIAGVALLCCCANNSTHSQSSVPTTGSLTRAFSMRSAGLTHCRRGIARLSGS